MSAVPVTIHNVLSQVTEQYPSHELGFITSSTHDSSIQATTFSSFNQYVRSLAPTMLDLGKPTGSVIIVYLTEHEDNMATVWACLLAGCVPCLQPALGTQQAHKEGHITQAHIINLFFGLEIYLLSELKVSASKYHVPADWATHTNDEAILFLTSGSTGFSKAVVHSHCTILATCSTKVEAYRLTPKTNVLNWVGLFGMAETCARCIYKPKHEFLDLGHPVCGCEMCIVNPEDGKTFCRDGESGELQVCGPTIFVHYYNNVEATSSSFVEGGWYRTSYVCFYQTQVYPLSRSSAPCHFQLGELGYINDALKRHHTS
ncbi:hypothetical protein EDB19DRAFT_1991465 [Suillus lakei]|nr:hypothetical protein EDB19DRAFT_1991465 [Suillus lakei]